jgi:Icc-related predicted phosphoesterase
MKLAIISDMHGDYELPPAHIAAGVDAILIGGDSVEDWLDIAKLEMFLKELNKVCPNIYATGGNHDILFDRHPTIPQSLPWNYLVEPKPFAKFQDYSIYGFPYSYYRTDSGDEKQFKRHNAYAVDGEYGMKESLRRVRADIVLSHRPAWGLCDAARYTPLGSYKLRDYIAEYNPKLFVCGHIHEAAGMTWYSDTLVVNAARTWMKVDL